LRRTSPEKPLEQPDLHRQRSITAACICVITHLFEPENAVAMSLENVKQQRTQPPRSALVRLHTISAMETSHHDEASSRNTITTTITNQKREHEPHHHAGAATKSEQPRRHPPCRHAQPREGEECESETLILGRDSALCVRLLLDSQTSQLVNTGQMVKVSNQLWSKLQKWLNKRGRIGNWTEIKLLIN